jgi:choline dehydrogenase
MRLSSPHFLAAVFALFHIAAATPSSRSQPSDRRAPNLSFEYIVVGSGAGGGPLASRLARAGHSVLLIEAGDDQGKNSNYTVPGFQAAVTEDPKMRWDIYVDHYQDQARAQRDPKYVYDIGDRKTHVGPNPPAGANPLGILFVTHSRTENETHSVTGTLALER